jgi:hypothetical protein
MTNKMLTAHLAEMDAEVGAIAFNNIVIELGVHHLESHTTLQSTSTSQCI